MNAQQGLRLPLIQAVVVTLILLGVGALAIFIAAVWPLLHVSSSPSPVQADPLNMVDAFHSAINQENVDTMLALFSEDATVIDDGSTVRGKEQIRNWILHSERMAGLHLRLEHSEVRDEKVFWYDIAYNGSEVEHKDYLLRWTAVTQNGKIQSLVVSLLPMPDGK